VLEYIVGIATEAGDSELRSEDIAYFDAREWTPKLEEEARRKERRSRRNLKPIVAHLASFAPFAFFEKQPLALPRH
jgi:hypothetical protein